MLNIACGERISVNKLIEYIVEEARAAGCIPAGQKFVPEYKPVRPGDVKDSHADIGAARALIGFDPKIKVQEGLKHTFAAFRKFTR